MRKQELEELQRLEAELMASEYADEEPIDEIGLLDDTWQDFADMPVDVYNTDHTDIDPDVISEEICLPKQRSLALPIALIVFLSCVVIFCAMKILGVV